MRRLHRAPLSQPALDLLCQRTSQILVKGNEHDQIAARTTARKAEANRLWDQEKHGAFQEIQAKLQQMAPGNGFCMYCESGEGSDIDHFRPKKTSPGLAYTWENYLWACSVCNSNYKRSEFPVDTDGSPLLINPVEEEPSLHLAFSPETGEYYALTPKGEQSNQAFGLYRETLLKGRKNAWFSVQTHIVDYADACRRDDHGWALHMQRTVCQHPHASLLLELLQILAAPAPQALVTLIHPRCLQAIDDHPEIRSWP
jgi:uncharacterized protein (TIGR02646 family)